MADAATPFPLAWPQGRERRLSSLRRDGKFKTGGRGNGLQSLTVAEALQRLQRELDMVRARFAVISTNLEPRLDGRPRSGQSEPNDPGVALYFQLADKPHCMPCDTYKRVADNIAAIAAHIEATRAIERHGVATVAEMFSGFAALPSPDQERSWREVLELHRESTVTLTIAEAAYRRLARKRHPDQGGDNTLMAELNRARDDARRELGDG
ncbi:MAG TPA: hypothetical protein VHY35_17880 [Stellaceae bacterium]|jgi:hypothetical protein|nr:hypothetical protein [Stellaceae bacterium]